MTAEKNKPKVGREDRRIELTKSEAYVLRVLERRHRIHVVVGSREHNACEKLGRALIGEPIRGMLTFE